MVLPLIPILLIGGTVASLALDFSTKPKSVIISKPQRSFSIGDNEITLVIAVIAVIAFIILVRK